MIDTFIDVFAPFTLLHAFEFLETVLESRRHCSASGFITEVCEAMV